MVEHENEHLLMADMLWQTLYNMNMSDPNNTGAKELTFYHWDNSATWGHTAAQQQMTPYAHVQAALMYALRMLTESEAEAQILRDLLSDNNESVTDNLPRARATTADNRKTALKDRYADLWDA